MLEEGKEVLEAPGEPRLDGIAVIGMAGRFPGASSIDELWRNLHDGVESISFFDDEALLAQGVEPSELKDPNYVKAGAVLDGVEMFDAEFFGFSPREAEIMDPQHRLFLEVAWEALEKAGYDTQRFPGTAAIYAGASENSYLANLYGNPEVLGAVDGFQLGLGNDKDFLALRTAYKLNLQGPAVTVQTACSTSLVAVHFAVQGLLTYQSDLALAGGVSVSVPQVAGYTHRKGGILAPDGHCRPFDARAAGTVGGSGLGVVVLKRLEEAVADGDHIHAVILASAANNDGDQKVGFTAPSVNGVRDVVAMAHGLAGIDPETVGYIETHGTGTPVGDPIEIAGMTSAFRAQTEENGFCALGSIKSNLGHLDAAAGIANLIKAVLVLEHGEIPASLHFESPNPEIDFSSTPFFVNPSLRPWPRGEMVRRAGATSLGFGGTNVHVVLEEAPVVPRRPSKDRPVLLPLSARTSEALDQMAKLLADHLEAHPETDLADVAFTLAVGRRRFKERRVLVCENTSEAVQALRSSAETTSRKQADLTIAPSVRDADRVDGEASFAGLIEAYRNASSTFRSDPAQASVEARQLLEAVGRLWTAGSEEDLSQLFERSRRRVPLPTYPFASRRFWVEPRVRGQVATASASRDGLTSNLEEHLYVPGWRRTPLLEPAVSGVDDVWLFLDEGGVGECLARRFERAVRVAPGLSFQKQGDRQFVLRPDSEEDYAALLRELGGRPPRAVIHLWSLSKTPPQFDDQLRQGFSSLRCLVRALATAGSSNIDLLLVANGVQSVAGHEEMHTGKAALFGASRVVGQEHLTMRCRTVDVTFPGPGGLGKERLADQLAAELASGSEASVAYRGGRRWVRTFEREADNGKKPNLRPSGVYWITGGLGRLGLLIARHLFQTSGVRLILSSRQGLPPKERWDERLASPETDEFLRHRIASVRALEEEGAEVLVLSANVASSDDMRRGLQQIDERWQELHGVIHAAGVVSEASMATILDVAPESISEHMASKIHGVNVLAELLEGRSLDFCCLISSTSSMFGGPGYFAYAAANRFLDAVAEARQVGGGTSWVSVAFDGWDADTEAPIASVEHILSAAQGLNLLDRALTSADSGRFVAMRGDPKIRAERWLQPPPSSANEALDEDEEALHPRPDLSTSFVAPSSPLEEQIAQIWQQLLAIEPIGRIDDFFELGGDSLLGMQLFAHLREIFEVELPVDLLFAARTVEAIAQELIQAESRPGQVETIARIRQRIEGLSPEEVGELLRQKKTKVEVG